MEPDYFRLLARYNTWANDRLYAACGRLDEAAYRAVRPSFFGSIHATLNHILVGDRIWLGRLTGRDPGIARLDQILYDDRLALREARIDEDARLTEVIAAIDPRRLDTTLDYATLAGQRQRTPLRVVLGHVFNHQTHHRGQVHDMLSQTAVPPPPLDLIYFTRVV